MSYFRAQGVICMMAAIMVSILTLRPALALEVLSWKACIDLASSNNGDLRAARASLRSTEYQEGVARSGLLPQINGASSVVRAGGGGAVSSSYAASLSATETLATGLADFGRISQAQANTKVAEASLSAAKARASFDLKSSYEAMRFAGESIRLTGEIRHRRESNLRLVELRFESGRENKGSVLLSKAYLEQARFDELQARQSLELAKAQLDRVLGLDDGREYVVREPIPVREPGEAAPDFRALAVVTPDHVQASGREESADAAITVARSGFFPTLSLTGLGSRTGSEFFADTDRWSLSLNLTIPFFSGGRDFYATKSAVAGWQSLEATRQNVDRDLLARLRQAYNAFVQAVVRLKVDASFREAAMTRAEIARNKYNNGLLTFEDWDIIENDLISREKAYLATSRDRVVAEAAWEQAQGKGVIP